MVNVLYHFISIYSFSSRRFPAVSTISYVLEYNPNFAYEDEKREDYEEVFAVFEEHFTIPECQVCGRPQGLFPFPGIQMIWACEVCDQAIL